MAMRSNNDKADFEMESGNGYNLPSTVGNALKYIAWLLKAVIFFVLFAFALNNQAPVNLHFFFGTIWQAPMVLVVLATFVLGLFAGILVMVPIWLNARRQPRPGFAAPPTSPTAQPDGI